MVEKGSPMEGLISECRPKHREGINREQKTNSILLAGTIRMSVFQRINPTNVGAAAPLY